MVNEKLCKKNGLKGLNMSVNLGSHDKATLNSYITYMQSWIEETMANYEKTIDELKIELAGKDRLLNNLLKQKNEFELNK